MQPAMSDINLGVYLDTNVDGSEYSYINDLALQDSHPYEQLRRVPQPSGETPPEWNGSSRRHHSESESNHSPVNSKTCGRRPPCWGWVVIFTCLLIAATVVALLAFFLTSLNSSANLAARDDISTATTDITATSIVITRPIKTSTVSATSTITIPSPKNCQDVYANQGTISDVYSIYPDGQKEVRVYCEQTLRGGGWTVFQRRMDGSVDFFRDWAQYKVGFGDPSGEYWVGNDNLHTLTANMDTQLLVELQYGHETRYAHYSDFWVLGEAQNYELHAAGYAIENTPGPGDALAYHNGYPFTTRDKDNDGHPGVNCAVESPGGWWYKVCINCNLNGLYNNSSKKGITWLTWTGSSISLSSARMLLKTK